jgi:hypothetical protein
MSSVSPERGWSITQLAHATRASRTRPVSVRLTDCPLTLPSAAGSRRGGRGLLGGDGARFNGGQVQIAVRGKGCYSQWQEEPELRDGKK